MTAVSGRWSLPSVPDNEILREYLNWLALKGISNSWENILNVRFLGANSTLDNSVWKLMTVKYKGGGAMHPQHSPLRDQQEYYVISYHYVVFCDWKHHNVSLLCLISSCFLFPISIKDWWLKKSCDMWWCQIQSQICLFWVCVRVCVRACVCSVCRCVWADSTGGVSFGSPRGAGSGQRRTQNVRVNWRHGDKPYKSSCLMSVQIGSNLNLPV